MDLKIKDVAELLNVSETTIRRWLSDGKIPAYKLNHQYRFNRSEIEHWVLGQKLGVEMEGTPFHEGDDDRMIKSGNMKFCLYRALHNGSVLHDIPGNTKEDVIKTTMQTIAKDLKVDAEVVTELLLDREKLQPTALNHGIGIPHTRDNLLNNRFDSVSIVFPENPIPYGALDEKPVHTLFFLFASDDKRHLHLLAKIAHLSLQDETHKLLQSKPSKEELLDYIKKWEGSLKNSS